ncbi:MAG TPA: alpha/beta fold hydrolase [Ktedonobacteraceae bacterium]|jgi:carboxylesterase|nr:alpha/beta fold hydrolase [Ktedonobacteraceae bacterium]
MQQPHSTTPNHHSKVGVLLIHGLNGSRDDMNELTAYLTDHGMLTENMLLPGHGTAVRDMLSLGWIDWACAVREEYRALQEQCDHIFLVGHSLGGALALHLAASEEVSGIVTMCAPLHMTSWLIALVRIASSLIQLVPTVREDINDPDARKRYARRAYRWTPLAPIDSLFRFLPKLRAELPHVTVPTLIMAATHDHVVPVRDGYEIYRHIGAQDKQLLILHHSYHVIMKDHDHEQVFAQTLAFIERQLSTTEAEQTA